LDYYFIQILLQLTPLKGKEISQRIIKRGEIYWVNFAELEEPEASLGTEINGKIRPALIVSNNLQNDLSNRVTILPMSTSIEKVYYPAEILYKDGKIMCDQIRSIDKRRMSKQPKDFLSNQLMEEVNQTLKELLELEK